MRGRVTKHLLLSIALLLNLTNCGKEADEPVFLTEANPPLVDKIEARRVTRYIQGWASRFYTNAATPQVSLNKLCNGTLSLLGGCAVNCTPSTGGNFSQAVVTFAGGPTSLPDTLSGLWTSACASTAQGFNLLGENTLTLALLGGKVDMIWVFNGSLYHLTNEFTFDPYGTNQLWIKGTLRFARDLDGADLLNCSATNITVNLAEGECDVFATAMSANSCASKPL